jgi:hypothetical protein
MKTIDFTKDIERLEREIQYLYIDFKRMLSQYHAFNEISTVKLKIKHAEESLRLKKRILHLR